MPAKTKSTKSTKSPAKAETNNLEKKDPLAGLEDLVEDEPAKVTPAKEEKAEEIIEDIDADSLEFGTESGAQSEKSASEQAPVPPAPVETETPAGVEEQPAGSEPAGVESGEEAVEIQDTLADSSQPSEQPPSEEASAEAPAEDPAAGGETAAVETDEGAGEDTQAPEEVPAFPTETSPALASLDDRSLAKLQIEGALFVSGNPLSIEDLNIKLEVKKSILTEALRELVMDYMDRLTSIEIVQVGEDKYMMQLKPEYTSKVKKFTSGGLIPEGPMRTLTIIALKQPISKSMLVKLRGSGAYEHVKILETKGYVKSDKAGRSQNLVTTERFADEFGYSRDTKKMIMQMKAQLGVKDDAESKPSTPPPPPPVPEG